MSYLSAFMWGIVTPGRLGEFSRILGIRGNKSVLLSFALFDRLLDVCAVLFLAIAGITLTSLPMHYPILVTGFFSALSLALIFFLRKFFKGNSFNGTNRFTRHLRVLVELKSLLTTKTCIYVFLLTLSAYLLLIIHFMFVSCALGAFHLGLLPLVPIVQIANLLPVTVGGFGLRESFFLLLSANLPVSEEMIVTSSMLWFSLNAFVGLLSWILVTLVLQIRSHFRKGREP